jgi:predicted Zn-dependent protease with MMP-like domain
MASNIKEKIQADLQKVKSTGQLRSEQIREIVKNAIAQVSDEFKAGSSEISALVKDAVLTVIDTFKDKGGEIKEDVTASIEGAMEAATSRRHEQVVATRSELKLLQEKLDQEEEKLQQEIDVILAEVADEPNGQGKDSAGQTAVKSAIAAMQNSEEVTLLKKRYAQLQAQIAIIRANLAARYGGRDHEVQHYLDEAKNWYGQIRPQAEAAATQIQDKHALVENKLGEAGVAIARRERKLKQNLRELLHTTADLFKDK